MPNQLSTMSAQEISQENARFMSSVYMWMTCGIACTGLVATYVGTNLELVRAIVSNRPLYYLLIFSQLGAVFYLSLAIQKMRAMTATLVYLGYAVLTGLTLSVIFLLYTRESIAHVFGITAFSFAGLSAFGFVTKKDLGPVGSFCMMGLFGMVGFAVMSMLFPSLMTSNASRVYGVVGVIVFAGLTAYDTQRIKQLNIIGNEGTEEDHKEAIFGALTLYLDFINLFLSLLRLSGRRK